jgi:hypothetical protein
MNKLSREAQMLFKILLTGKKITSKAVALLVNLGIEPGKVLQRMTKDGFRDKKIKG